MGRYVALGLFLVLLVFLGVGLTLNPREARKGSVPVYGLNYKDTRQDARRWLTTFGDPYVASAFDEDGRVGIEWGVYGVPETFVIDRKGVIRHKLTGPVTPENWEKTLQPLIQRLQTAD